jgi:hypothetical protein
MIRSRRGLAIVAVIAAIALALAANTLAVDSATRAAVARSGGTVMETGIVLANVKVEGEGPPIVLIQGSVRRSIGGTTSRLSSRPITASFASI